MKTLTIVNINSKKVNLKIRVPTYVEYPVNGGTVIQTVGDALNKVLYSTFEYNETGGITWT